MAARSLWLSVCLAVVAVLASCGSSDKVTVAPADGEALYVASCSSCHGAQASGSLRGPSLLSQVYEPGHHPDEAFRSAVANGSPQHHWQFGEMPGIGGLNAVEVDAIVSYVRGLQEELGFTPYG